MTGNSVEIPYENFLPIRGPPNQVHTFTPLPDLGREAMTMIERDRGAHQWSMPHEKPDYIFRH
jgi:hypothetical protein